MANIVRVGQVYKDTNHSYAKGSKRRLKVLSVNNFTGEADIKVIQDRNGKRLSAPVVKTVSLARFNGRSRGYQLAK